MTASLKTSSMKERSAIRSVWRTPDRGGSNAGKSPPPPQDAETLFDTKAHGARGGLQPPGRPACAPILPVSPEHKGQPVGSLYPGEPILGAPGDTAGGTEDTVSRPGPGREGLWLGACQAGHLTAPRAGRPAPRTAAFHISGKGHEVRARTEVSKDTCLLDPRNVRK